MADRIAEEYPGHGLRKHLTRVYGLCGIDQEKELYTFGKYKQLEDLFLGFTSHYRNLLVHGTWSAITNKELLRLLIKADKRFIEELQAALKSIGRPSLFDKPRAWNATCGDDKKAAIIFKGLFGNKQPQDPITSEQAEKILNDK
jgi:hypothetical protein